MIIYPAVDLLDGRCVRLARGSFDHVTVYSEDPVEQADRFATQGARALHVVDLDGARSGAPAHLPMLSAICRGFPGVVQTGGGIRTEADIEQCLDRGVSRVILGTAAAARPDWLARTVSRFGAERLAAAVDLRGNDVMVSGWLRSAPTGVPELVDGLSEAGIETIVFTDTLRDGMLGSADAVRAGRFVRAGFETIVAGGVTTVDDIRRLRDAGAAGAVIGSALYERRLTLGEAIAAADEGTAGEDTGSAADEGTGGEGVAGGSPLSGETAC